MEPFDSINAALTGKQQAPQPKPTGKVTGVSDFSTAREVRANQMRAQGLDPVTGDPLPKSTPPALRGSAMGSGLMDAMHYAADKHHPVGK